MLTESALELGDASKGARLASEPMAVLCLSYEYPPLGGGGSHVVRGLAEQLAAGGDSVELITMGYPGLADREAHGNLRIVRLRTGRLRRSVCSAAEMLPYVISCLVVSLHRVRRRRFDVIHAHFVFPDGLVAVLVGAVARLPVVITAHGSDVPNYNPHRFTQLHRMLMPLWRWVARRAHRLVCPSRFIRALAEAAASEVETVVIPNGFHSGRFATAAGERKHHVLVVSRIFERKGVQDLLRSAADLPEDWDVVVVGDGPYLDEVRELAARLEIRARFTGALPNDSAELRRELAEASIFCLPSHAENFPVSLLEAMDAGLAIVTTAGTGCAEVVGDAGLLAAPGDIDGLRGALRRLMGDPGLRIELGARARRRVKEKFDWPVVARSYRRVLLESARVKA